MSDTDLTLGQRLRAARESAGLSIRQLAAQAEVNFGYLARLESGQRPTPSAEVLQRLAEALDLEPSELLTYIGVKPASTLPAPGVYFRRKLGVDAEEAEVLARLIEDYQAKKEGGKRHEE